ncbi:hypothetical protein PVAP13_9KG238000 [Panicum virgatum]|uniref:Uncharacterized protein n=1 Tax=Panicum virgatum TaxID=38727 RepID=A0A8T0NTW3_PANVG|nr:hypothetical protein PVAP13_9KG238000 [Panicum virgatum]
MLVCYCYPRQTTSLSKPPVRLAASDATRWGRPLPPRRRPPTDTDLPPGADLSLTLAPSPRVSLLIVPPRLFLDAPIARNFPAVLAVDPSGLLLHANQVRAASASVFAIPEPKLISKRAFLGVGGAGPGGGRALLLLLAGGAGRGAAGGGAGCWLPGGRCCGRWPGCAAAAAGGSDGDERVCGGGERDAAGEQAQGRGKRVGGWGS